MPFYNPTRTPLLLDAVTLRFQSMCDVLAPKMGATQLAGPPRRTSLCLCLDALGLWQVLRHGAGACRRGFAASRVEQRGRGRWTRCNHLPLTKRPGSQKLALGAVATGATGLTIHHNTKATQRHAWRCFRVHHHHTEKMMNKGKLRI